MKLQDCTEYHLRQMLAACQVVLQQYLVLPFYDRSGNQNSNKYCYFCMMVDLFDASCFQCPHEIINSQSCSRAGYGHPYKRERISTLKTVWIPAIELELEKRGW